MSSRFRSAEIKIDDHVISNGMYPNLDKYFSNGSLLVIDVIEDAPGYAGGKFIICRSGKEEIGFYINGVKKV